VISVISVYHTIVLIISIKDTNIYQMILRLSKKLSKLFLKQYVNKLLFHNKLVKLKKDINIQKVSFTTIET